MSNPTPTRVLTMDEWATEHYPQPALTEAEVEEALSRLGDLWHLVGGTPHEVMQMLVGVLARRDGAARYILHRLRDIDAEAKAP